MSSIQTSTEALGCALVKSANAGARTNLATSGAIGQPARMPFSAVDGIAGYLLSLKEARSTVQFVQKVHMNCWEVQWFPQLKQLCQVQPNRKSTAESMRRLTTCLSTALLTSLLSSRIRATMQHLCAWQASFPWKALSNVALPDVSTCANEVCTKSCRAHWSTKWAFQCPAS